MNQIISAAPGGATERAVSTAPGSSTVGGGSVPASLNDGSRGAAYVDTTDAEMGAQLTAQFEKAVGGIRDVVVFGAMMIRVKEHTEPRVRTRTHGGKIDGSADKGTGLKGWLETHAPEVNRATAYRFMELAEGIQEEFKLGKKADLHLLLTAPDEELGDKLRGKRASILDFIDGKSQRQLLLSLGSAEGKSRGGHHPSQQPQLTPEQERAQFVEQCQRESVVAFNAVEALDERWKMCPDGDIEIMIHQADTFARAARAWMKVPQRDRTRIDAEKLLTTGKEA